MIFEEELSLFCYLLNERIYYVQDKIDFPNDCSRRLFMNIWVWDFNALTVTVL